MITLRITWNVAGFRLFERMSLSKQIEQDSVLVEIIGLETLTKESVATMGDSVCVATLSHNFSKEMEQKVAEPQVRATPSIFGGYFGAELQKEWRLAQETLEEVTQEIMDMVRWRAGVPGRQDPLVNPRVEYQFEGDDWKILEPIPLLRRMFDFPFSMQAEFIKELQDRVDTDRLAPVARSLMREARDSWFVNPRSSLIVTMAAFEIGIKSCLPKLDPGLKSVVESRRSPSPSKLLKTHLIDALAGKSRFVGYEPPIEYNDEIEAASQARNSLVHADPSASKEQQLRLKKALEHTKILALESTQNIVSDLLWLFDFYSGEDWALKRISVRTKQLMIDRNNGRNLPLFE